MIAPSFPVLTVTLLSYPNAFTEMPAVTFLVPVRRLVFIASAFRLPMTVAPNVSIAFPAPKTRDPCKAFSGLWNALYAGLRRRNANDYVQIYTGLNRWDD